MIVSRPLTYLESLVADALRRAGPAPCDEELHSIIVGWAKALRAKGESHGRAGGTIAGIIWPTACRLSRDIGSESVVIDIRLEVARWVTEVYGPVQSRARGK